jgi:hypothetical protein
LKLKLRSQRFYKIALFEVWFFSTLKPNIICHDGREREREGEGEGVRERESERERVRRERTRDCAIKLLVTLANSTQY